jgi:hypothetical protein
MEIVLREDIPLPAITSPNTDYAPVIDKMLPGQSFVILQTERSKLLMYVLRKYGKSRLYATQTYKGELYFQRVK